MRAFRRRWARVTGGERRVLITRPFLRLGTLVALTLGHGPARELPPSKRDRGSADRDVSVRICRTWDAVLAAGELPGSDRHCDRRLVNCDVGIAGASCGNRRETLLALLGEIGAVACTLAELTPAVIVCPGLGAAACVLTELTPAVIVYPGLGAAAIPDARHGDVLILGDWYGGASRIRGADVVRVGPPLALPLARLTLTRRTQLSEDVRPPLRDVVVAAHPAPSWRNLVQFASTPRALFHVKPTGQLAREAPFTDAALPTRRLRRRST